VNGHIVYGETTIDECRMGDTLVRHGILSSEDLRRSLELMQSRGQRLGEVLVDERILDHEGRQEAVALQVREVLRCVFTWRQGEYSFEERAPEAFRGYDRPLPLSTGEVILDAVWSIADGAVLGHALGDLDRILVATVDPLLQFQRVTLTPTDGFILSRIDGTLTAREVLGMVPVSPEEGQRSLFGLLCIGMVEYVAAAVPRPPQSSLIPALRRRIIDAHAALAGANHFDTLGVPRTAGSGQIRAAFARLARQFHPDVHHQPLLSDLREKLDELFVRISEAHRVLSEPVSRAAYEAALFTTPRQSARPGKETARATEPAPEVDPSIARLRAEDALETAEERFASGRYWDALQDLSDPVVLGLKGRLASRARVLRARCCLKNPYWRKDAEKELKTVIANDPGYADAYFLLGTIYRAAGADARAANMFRKTLSLRPRHSGAREELAVLEGAALPAVSGLWNRLRTRR
jgi:hypothetical protein